MRASRKFMDVRASYGIHSTSPFVSSCRRNRPTDRPIDTSEASVKVRWSDRVIYSGQVYRLSCDPIPTGYRVPGSAYRIAASHRRHALIRVRHQVWTVPRVRVEILGSSTIFHASPGSGRVRRIAQTFRQMSKPFAFFSIYQIFETIFVHAYLCRRYGMSRKSITCLTRQKELQENGL